MPVTTSAAKALRRDRRRTLVNLTLRSQVNSLVRQSTQRPTADLIRQAYSLLDRAAQNHILHPNRAAKLKSKLAKLPPVKKRP
ncbi:hypothetical protein A2W24_03125 [Microgenomates group bacterium RBG_16_45_19]|nr:MAG: hypothetical protein A2W24_03125 [Microgenomates group bacterium RBG_16_45_19]